MNPARVLLVAYSGYPEVNSTWLHLDNGLALMAGALMAAGHQVRIKDLQTLQTWQRLFPNERRGEYFRLRQGFDDYLLQRGTGEVLDDSVLEAGQVFDHWIAARNDGIVQQLGHEVAAQFADFAPHVIGLKLWSQNSFADQVALARVLKWAFPTATLVAGGPAVELLQEAVLRHTDVFDLLVYGPGEQALVALARDKAAGRLSPAALPSVIYRDELGQTVKTTRVDPPLGLGVLPYYGRDVYVDYDDKLHNVHVESDRGCNFKCEFCIHPHKSGRQQKRTAADFVAELAELNRRHGFSYFHLAGSDPPFRHMVEVAREVVGNGLDFGFMGFQSLRALDDEGLAVLQQANFDRFWVGIESGDAEIVFDIQKGRKLERLEARSDIVRQRGIAITGSVITPCPGEREGSVDATIAVLQKIRPDVVLMYPPIVQPGSTWFRATGYPVNVADRTQVEDLFVRHGMEWHPGNKVLPWAFTTPQLNELVEINGKGYTDVYCESALNQRRIQRMVAGRTSVAQFGDRSRHRSRLKRLYFKSQVSVGQAIRSGEFAAAQAAVSEYNAFVLRGGYSAH